MVKKYTNNQGVDYVLNSLTGDKLLASVRCLAKRGKFIELGKFDLTNNNSIVLHLLEKECDFIGVGIDKYLEHANTGMYFFILKISYRISGFKFLPNLLRGTRIII